MPVEDILLEAKGLTTVYGGTGGFLRKRTPAVRAIDQVSVKLMKGETLGIVGESGCGKSTLGRTLLGLIREAEGEIRLKSERVDGLSPKIARKRRSAIQYVHQDAAAALDPWWSIGRTLAEPIGGSGDAGERVEKMLHAVGLDPAVQARYPHELSGGQLRRVALARILLMQPEIVILDEPTAGLDLSIQASVLRLLRDLKARFGLTNIFVSHDLSVVRLMCDRVAVMYLGRIVEEGETEALFAAPRHPYTRALLDAVPRLDSKANLERPVSGDVPNLRNIPSGCAFRTRCPHAVDACATTRPELDDTQDGVRVACIRWRELMPVPAVQPKLSSALT